MATLATHVNATRRLVCTVFMSLTNLRVKIILQHRFPLENVSFDELKYYIRE